MSSNTDLLQIQKGEAAAFRKLQQDAKLCIEELREEIARVADLHVKQRLMCKVANLEGNAATVSPPMHPVPLAGVAVSHPRGRPACNHYRCCAPFT